MSGGFLIATVGIIPSPINPGAQAEGWFFGSREGPLNNYHGRNNDNDVDDSPFSLPNKRSVLAWR